MENKFNDLQYDLSNIGKKIYFLPIIITLMTLTLMPEARAARITIDTTGDPSLPGLAPFGAVGPLPIGGMLNQRFGIVAPGAAGANNFFTGRVLASNVGGSSFRLTLTDLEYSSDTPLMGGGPVNVSIRIQQDYVIGAGVRGFMGSHNFSGIDTFTNPGQSASINKTSTHEATVLMPLNDLQTPPPDVVPTMAAAPPIPVPIALPNYSIDTTYSFTINPALPGNVVSIQLPISGNDIAEGSSTIIPEPSSILSILALGSFGTALTFKRKLKSFNSSEKETEKVS